MKDKRPNLDHLKGVLTDLEYLIKAHELLDSVYSEIGGYGGTISKPTLMRLNDFFGFDDSE